MTVSGTAPVTIATGYVPGTIEVTDLDLTAYTKVKLNGSPTGNDVINATGDVDLGGAELDLNWVGEATSDVLLIDNDGANAITGTFQGLAEGDEIIVGGQTFWITYVGGSGNDVELIAPTSSVKARNIFYNQSAHDGNTAGVSSDDDDAIATDKTALLPGNTATFDNLTSYTQGINGIMVDIAGSHPNITANDFVFKVGTNAALGSWSTAPAPTTISVRSGAGVDGSDRVEIIWANGDIRNKWLQVSVLSTIDTGLADVDTFLFGNKAADSGYGNYSGATTNATDAVGAMNNQTSTADVTNPYDYNRDGQVTSTDSSLVYSFTGLLSYVKSSPTILFTNSPTKWVPGEAFDIAVSAPVTSDGLIDSSIVAVNFYQDVNGNGVLDSGDLFLETGTAIYDSGSNLAGWTASIDVADFTAGDTAILAVPVNSTGALDTTTRLVGGAVPAGGGQSADNPFAVLVGVNDVDIDASTLAGGFGNPNNTVQNTFVVTAAISSAAAFSSGVVFGDDFYGQGFASSSFSLYTSPNAVQAVGHASASSIAIGTFLTNQNAVGVAESSGIVQGTIVGNAPIGTPVTLTVVAFAYSLYSGVGRNGGWAGFTPINVTVGNNSFDVSGLYISDATGSGALGYNVAIPVTARVGDNFSFGVETGSYGTLNQSLDPFGEGISDSLFGVIISTD